MTASNPDQSPKSHSESHSESADEVADKASDSSSEQYQTLLRPEVFASLTILSLTIVFILLVGGLMSGAALRDTDSCWTMATGRWICQHAKLPFTDPFSSNVNVIVTPGPGQAIIVYQWFCEVVFYTFYQVSGLVGLCLLSAAIETLAFVILPGWILGKGKVHPVLTLFLLCLTLCGTFTRFVARAEIWSYLAFALILCSLWKYPAEKIPHRCMQIFAASVGMCLWANTHISFPVGIALMGFYMVVKAIEPFINSDTPSNSLSNATSSNTRLLWLAALPAAGVAVTFINPWFLKLYWLAFNMLTSQSPTLERASLGPKDFAFPGAATLALTGLIIVWRASKSNWRKNFVAICFFLASLYCTFSHLRLTPFGLLMCMFAIANVQRTVETTASSLSSENTVPPVTPAQNILVTFWRKIVNEMRNWVVPTHPIYMTAVLGLAIAGGFKFLTKDIPPVLGPSSPYFRPPAKAVEFLKTHPMEGRMLNTPLFGSYLTWYMDKAPDIFIDSRFAVYKQEICDDTVSMLLCQKDWRSLLDKYGIKWIFVEPNREIVIALSKDPNWEVVYVDKTAAIIKRRS